MPLPMGFLPKPQPSWPIWAHVLYYIAVGLVVLTFIGGPLVKSIKFVPKSHAGMRTRNAKPRRRKVKKREVLLGWKPDADGKIWWYVSPGMHVVVPFLDNIETISVQDDMVDIPNPRVERTADRKQTLPDVVLNWRVIDSPQGVHDALFNAKNLESTVIGFGRAAVGQAAEESTPDDAREDIEGKILKLAEPKLLKYGVQPLDAAIASVPRSGEQVLGDALNGDSPGGDQESGGSGVAKGRVVATLGLVEPEGA